MDINNSTYTVLNQHKSCRLPGKDKTASSGEGNEDEKIEVGHMMRNPNPVSSDNSCHGRDKEGGPETTDGESLSRKSSRYCFLVSCR